MENPSFSTVFNRWTDPARSAEIGLTSALLANQRQAVPFSDLLPQISALIDRLHSLGLGRGDRIALVLPDGMELALCFLATAAAMTAAPLNPSYRENEFDFYLQDLDASAVLLPAGSDSPARVAASKSRLSIIEVEISADSLILHGTPILRKNHPEMPGPDDLALLLHTSGTTARPKLVPLLQRNLLSSAQNIVHTLHLTPADRCLNLMPLFHIHGLVAGLLAPLSAGCGVICPSGFDAPRFFQWLDEFRPTWYTAVPTMHQSILARAPANPDAISRSVLRFIRSSSSPLAPAVLAELESVFHAPVVEAYGMTEAAHQIACNPLPPAAHKPGTVGLPAGPEIAIMAQDSAEILASGAVGEIVIRGDNVMPGYLANPAANTTAFTDGWFRTGDLGSMDAEGYLTIRGRLKEIINRGGEKISPREIDEVLLTHPNVRQAVAFAVPDTRLGELIAAAVVLADPNQLTSEDELRRFAAARLADYKVPMSISIVNEIPKGPTGKIQRIGLAVKLGITGPQLLAPNSVLLVEPGSELEKIVASYWSEVLDSAAFGIHHGFLSIGGDSILAARIVSRIRSAFDIPFTLIDFFNFPTIASQAALIHERILADVLQMSNAEVARKLDGENRPSGAGTA